MTEHDQAKYRATKFCGMTHHYHCVTIIVGNGIEFDSFSGEIYTYDLIYSTKSNKEQYSNLAILYHLD